MFLNKLELLTVRFVSATSEIKLILTKSVCLLNWLFPRYVRPNSMEEDRIVVDFVDSSFNTTFPKIVRNKLAFFHYFQLLF